MQRLFITALACLLSISLFSQNEYSLSFNGNDYVNCGQNSSLDLSTSFTFSAKIKIDNFFQDACWGGPCSNYIFTNGCSDCGCGSYNFGVGYDGKIFVGANSGGIGGSHPYCWPSWNENPGVFQLSSSSSVLSNECVNVAVTYNGSQVKFFINGVLDNFYETILIDPYTPAYDLIIGQEQNLPYQSFVGNMYNVQIWNIALDDSEILNYII